MKKGLGITAIGAGLSLMVATNPVNAETNKATYNFSESAMEICDENGGGLNTIEELRCALNIEDKRRKRKGNPVDELERILEDRKKNRKVSGDKEYRKASKHCNGNKQKELCEKNYIEDLKRLGLEIDNKEDGNEKSYEKIGEEIRSTFDERMTGEEAIKKLKGIMKKSKK